ncbi:5851_t:CDS:2 [Gigaspora rosea]|nr:5851_t:CDS:2 [Gigaspora rosea]
MTKLNPYFFVFLSLLVLVLVLRSFSGFDLSIPEQAPYRFTGYLMWFPELKGYDGNKFDTALLFNQVVLIFSSYFAIKWTYNPPTKRSLITRFYSAGDSVAMSVPTTDFNRAIAIYIVMTLLAGLTIFFAGVGKIWATVGVLHNASEFLILLILGSGGKFNLPVFWPIIAIFYISFITITCILLKFPYDALWFKSQGLCFDWALIIEFTRIYLTTLHELKNGGANRDNLGELVEKEDKANIHHDAIVHYPHHLLLLVVGSVFHALGNLNLVFTIYKFSFNAYWITYPAYAYYTYVDLHVSSIYPQKRIYLPETPYWKVAVISISSITLSLLTIRLGI